MIRRRNWCIFICLAVIIILASGGIAASEPSTITMTVKPGFNGIYKTNKIVPVHITIVNNGEEFNGKLVIAEEEIDPHRHMLNYTYHITVKSGETKAVELLVPGELITNNKKVNLIVDSQVRAGVPIHGLSVRGDSGLILGVSHEGDIHSPLLDAGQENFPWMLTGKRIYLSELPTNFFVLQGIDIMVIDGKLYQDVTVEQREALDRWVISGGLMILSQPEVISGKPLASAQIADETILYREQHGKGVIIYSTYDMLQSSGLTKEEESQLWGDIIRKEIYNGTIYQGDFWGNNWQYSDAASVFENITPPNLLLLGGVFLGYLLIIGPVLYFILKRWDRRDMAWLIIPAISLTVTLVIISVGNNRVSGDGVVETVSRIELLAPEIAIAQGATGVVIPKGGQYTMEILHGNTYAIPAQRGRVLANSMSVIFDEVNENKTLAFRQVSQWSLRHMLFNSIINNYGMIEGQLVLRDNIIKGELVNNTGVDLEDVLLTAGNRVYSLGQWPNGHVFQFDKAEDWEKYPSYHRDHYMREIEESISPQRRRMIGNNSTYVTREVTYSKENKDIYSTILNPKAYLGQWEITINGWSREQLAIFNIPDLTVEQNYNHLLTQSISVDIGGDDKVFYPYGSIYPQDRGVEYYYGPNGRGIQILGTSQFDFAMDEGLKVESLSTNFMEQQVGNITTQIYNWHINSWEPYTASDIIDSQKAQFYISAKGVFRVRFINETGERVVVPEPAIQVLGRVD